MARNKLSLFILSLLAVTALALAPACSSGDDDDDGTPDASTNNGNPDAMTNNTPDAMSQSVTDEFIDEGCAAQTDCGGLLGTGPNDYACLVLAQGDTVGICASPCATNADCMDNYTGGGTPGCIWQLQGADTMYCGVQCASNDDCGPNAVCDTVGQGMACIGDNTGGGGGS